VTLVRRFEAGERASALALEAGVLTKSLYQWRAAYLAWGLAGLDRKRGRKPGGRAAAALSSSPDAVAAAARPPDERAQARIGELERAGWPSTGGPRFFSRSLAVMGREAPRERRTHLFAVIEEMTREPLQGEPDTNTARIAHLIEIARLSRASYYRWLEPKLSKRDDADLRDLIQRLALQRRYEGYRRLTKRLSDQGLVANLARGLEPTGLDQLWVADITYIRLAEGFVYLAVVVDAFSRKVVGWALDDHLEARLAIEALDIAITARNPPPGLIHHSDRGVQTPPTNTRLGWTSATSNAA
jgi:putative transposase